MPATTQTKAVPPKNVRGISVYVKPEIFEALKVFAEKQDRSVSNLASHVLSEWVREKMNVSNEGLDP